MVIYAFASLSGKAAQLHNLLKNILEPSMLSLFINTTNFHFNLAREDIQSATFAITLMRPLLIAGAPELVLIYRAWDEYLDMIEIILGIHTETFQELIYEPKTCAKYWKEWNV